MDRVVTSRHEWMRRFPALLAYVSAVLLLMLTAAPSYAQVDWRSALVIRFDPTHHAPAADRNGEYLGQVAQGLESGWIRDLGAAAISVGPIFTPEAGPPSIDPSLGTEEAFHRLAQVARESGTALALHMGASAAGSELANWAAGADVTHLIVDETVDAAALRATLGSTVWIGGGEGQTGTDAVISAVPVEQLQDDTALRSLYAALAERSHTERIPSITFVGVPAGAAAWAARVLMMPGAVEISAGAMPPDVSDLWRRVAAFRSQHPAVAAGEHVDLVNNTFAFARTASDDRVVVVFGASGRTTINVSRIFPDNALIQDALSGQPAFVSFGMATFDAGEHGVLLIEEAL